MSNMVDYIDWRGDIKLTESNLNEIDKMILSRFSYLPFEKVNANDDDTIGTIAKRFCETLKRDEYNIAGDYDLVNKLNKSARFNELKVTDYYEIFDEDVQKQFAAICIHLPGNIIYVSYCGTDDTMVGWKEDFNLSFMTGVPAQKEGVKYLNKISKEYPEKKLLLGGHSKGGNVAVYSAVFSNKTIRDKIIEVVNHDGPGFDDEVLKMKSYQEILGRIHTFIPQSSVFGRLLGHKEEYKIVKSDEKGIMQHDIYSWQVIGTNIIQMEKTTNGSDFVDTTMRNWLKNIPMEQRKDVIDAIYSLIMTRNAKTWKEFNKKRYRNIGAILKQYKNLSENDKEMIKDAATKLANAAKESLTYNFKETNNNATS